MVLARVSACRLCAAVMIAAVLLARIYDLLVVVVLESGDDLFEVVGDLAVHLGHAGLAAGFGFGDDLQGLLAVLPVLGQELGGGEEHRACQAPLTELTPGSRRVVPRPSVDLASFAAWSNRRRDGIFLG
jgi:hypothetical protein